MNNQDIIGATVIQSVIQKLIQTHIKSHIMI